MKKRSIPSTRKYNEMVSRKKSLYFFTNKIKNYKKLQTKLFRIRNQYYTVEKSKLYRSSRTKKKK